MVRSTFAAALLLSLCCTMTPAQQKDSAQPSAAAQAAQSQQPAASDKKTDGATAEQNASAQQKPAEPAKPMTPEEARQAQLMADTQRLYQLTQELKAEVDKSNKDTLSIQVIKKADEVEKLARSLKERMRSAQ